LKTDQQQGQYIEKEMEVEKEVVGMVVFVANGLSSSMPLWTQCATYGIGSFSGVVDLK
jgi:hypothetical protein